MKLQIVLVCLILLFEYSLNAQTNIIIPLNNENIEIQLNPTPLPNGYFPNIPKTTAKPLTANSFTNNASCPTLSSNIHLGSGNFINSFFGGDKPSGQGFGFVPTSILLDSILKVSSFPITLTCDFFARNSVADYNEFYFWLGNYNHGFFNPSNSILPSANVQEGLIIGGTPEIALINNSRTPFLSSERLFTLNQNFTQYNVWTTLTVTINMTCNNQFVIEKFNINGKDLIMSPLNLGAIPSINPDSMQIGICVDDLAKNLSITFHPPDTTFLNYTVCPEEVLQINGITYPESGTFQQSLQNQYGCDSLIQIDIRHFPTTEKTKQLSLCEASSFTINGITYDQEGTYFQETEDENGCPTPLTITLSACRNNCAVIDSSLCYNNDTFPTFDFEISRLWESSAQTATYQSPLLADVDNDCIPEIIVSSVDDFSRDPRITSGITFILSSTGETLRNIGTPFYSWGGPTNFALADVNADGLPEIVLAAANVSQNPPNQRGRLVCYDTFGNLIWTSDRTFGDFTGNNGSSGAPAFADFNQDGIPEVYIYNEIFNAQTGVKLASGGNNGLGRSSDTFNGFSNATTIAADLDSNPDDLELAAGYTIYQVDITNPDGISGNSMIPLNIFINNIRRDGYTSIGDINGDRKLDVVVSSQGNSQFSRLYVYTLNNNTPVLLASTTMPTSGIGCCPDASGPAFVGDLDGSGTASIGVTRPYLLLAYKYNGTSTLRESWRLSTNDESGSTGMTMFDFNQDGIQEIVYRDETLLRIINGSVSPPIDLTGFSCTSGTGSEYPIVGDIDFSGQSKICVPCADENRNRGKLRVFGAPNNKQKWAPSRGVWNQYNYHVFNITDQLTVPAVMKNNATLSNGRFNNFLVQTSLLDSSGNFLQTSVELGGEITCLFFDPLLNLYTVHFDIANAPTASASMTEPIKISFYNGNPSTGGSLIGVYTINLSLQPGRVLEGITYSFTTSELSSLYMIVNYDGEKNSGVFVPGQFETSECSFENNFSILTEIKEIRTITSNFCQGDSIFINNEWIFASGEYFDFLPTLSGCDSVIRYNLIVHDTFRDTLIFDLCVGQLAEIDQITYTTDTIFSISGISQFGCDSTKTYVISFSEPVLIQENHILCQGDSIFINNQWIQSDITLYDTLPTLPCPTFTQDNVTFFPTYFNIEKYTLCPGDTLFRHDVNLFETGLYNLVFQTVNGCDSLFLVEIEALDFPSEPIVEPDCDNYLYTLTVESEDDWSPFWSNGANSLTTIYPDSVNAFLDWTHDSLTCRVVYNFLLHPIPLSAPVFAFQDSIIYPGKPITLTLENPGELWSVDWSPGYLMSCDTCFINTITTTLPAEIGVILTHQTGCDFRYNFFLNVDPTLDIQIPNIFSPEADVPNNKWSWLVPDCFEVLTLKLYDRWGNLVFDREKPGTVDWEGYFNGMLVEQGVYTYITKYLRPDGSIQTKTGDVTMILLK
ncbi:MAG: gliding motility-associated C-terminal domain-containing protein [Saprospiraceae bacterium]|nr:gliding motility-associated C-terminal domain-containing protein [Saprospiraceae bacterium]